MNLTLASQACEDGFRVEAMPGYSLPQVFLLFLSQIHFPLPIKSCPFKK